MGNFIYIGKNLFFLWIYKSKTVIISSEYYNNFILNSKLKEGYEKNIFFTVFNLKKEIDIDQKYKKFWKRGLGLFGNSSYIVIREKTEEEKNEE